MARSDEGHKVVLCASGTFIEASEENMEDENVTPVDLMSFLRGFKESMEANKEALEAKIDSTIAKIDDSNKRMDTKLSNIDKEITNLRSKADIAEERSKRMDGRLRALEEEMTKSASLRKKSDQLRNTLTNEQDSSLQPPLLEQVTTTRNDPFQSEWARKIQRLDCKQEHGFLSILHKTQDCESLNGCNGR